MLSVEHSRKRPRSNSGSSHSAIKRTRIDRNFASLSSENQDIISKATSNFQFPSGAAPIAINNLSNPFQQSGDGLYILTQQPEQTLQPLSGTFWDFVPEHYPQQSVVGGEELLTNGLAPTTIMHGPTCLPDKCFRFARTPRQLAERFTGLVPLRQALTNQPNSTGEYHDHLENPGNGAFVSEKAFIPSSGANPYACQPYFSNPHNQILRPVAEEQGGQFFACDEIDKLPPWQSNYHVLQPTPVETRQPSINAQNMTYPMDTTYQVESLWNLDTNNEVHGVGRHYTTQLYEREGGDSNLKDDQYSEELGAADRALARIGLGPSRRRPFQNHQDRIQTAQTRKDKACLRCRMQHIRCFPDPSNPQGVCLTCQKVSSLKVPNLPCVRYKITEIRLFKRGQVPGFDWTQRWPDLKLKDISHWASTETRLIRTTEGYSLVPLELKVREFVPVEGDVLKRYWCVDGGIKKSVSVPCFAISDVNAAQKAYKDYINRGGAEFFKGWLHGRNELLLKTYGAAIEAGDNPNTSQEEAELLKMVLRLWVAIRITTRSIRICGEDTLGMTRDLMDETSPLHGEIPVPPVMGAQIELILIQGIQIPLRKTVLDKLQKLVAANKPNTWFTLYLCIFILLHNCSMITKYDAGYAKKHGFPRTYARPTMVEECHTGANVLLAYWHYCNKGSKPFAPGSNTADFHAMSELKPYQTAFVKETSNYVQANANSWKSLQQKQAYEHDYYFVSQLYEQDWHPRFGSII